MTEDEMVGWHHQLDGHEFEQALQVGDGGSLVCCSPWGLKELDMTKQLNWTELNTCLPQSIPENCRGRKTPKLILQGHHHLGIKTRQTHHLKGKLKANNSDENGSKNPQQNTRKQNSTTY